jgi:hypothetical protein
MEFRLFKEMKSTKINKEDTPEKIELPKDA